MGKKDPRVDAYIKKSADFAQPILIHIRKLVHSACPEVEEEMKWSFPHFMYKGMLCGMASFKHHCALGFWKGSLILGNEDEGRDDAMGHFGKITSRADLPKDTVLTGYIREAVRLNDAGITVPKKPRSKVKKELVVPDFFTAAIKKNKKAQKTFEEFSYSNKKEYLEWVTEAKREETRQTRLSTAIKWMAEGKPRNWKYMNC